MKLPVASHTFLATFRRCRHQAYRKYIKKDLPPYVQSPEAKKGDEIHKALEKRIKTRAPLAMEYQTFEPFAAPFDQFGDKWVESRLAINSQMKPVGYFDVDVFMRGQADVACFAPDKTTVIIGDFKSGKKWEDPTELEEHAMLLKAVLAYNSEYDTYVNFKGFYIWLKTGEIGKIYDLSDTQKTWRSVQSTMQEVEQSAKADAWPKNSNPLCGFCDVLDCEHNRKGK